MKILNGVLADVGFPFPMFIGVYKVTLRCSGDEVAVKAISIRFSMALNVYFSFDLQFIPLVLFSSTA